MMLTLVATSVVAAQSNQEQDINRRPLTDYADSVRDQVASGRVNLSAPFVLELKGKLEKSGKINSATAKITRSEGDAGMLEIAKEAVSAVSDAGYFRYLVTVDVTDVTVLMKQDETAFVAKISSEAASDARARSISTMLAFGTRMAIERNVGSQPISDSDRCDLTFLRALSTSSNGKTVMIEIALPKSGVSEMLKAKLKAN